MKKFALKMAMGSALLLALAACSETDEANISTHVQELIAEKEISFDIDYTLQAETYDSLPSCTSNRSGDVAVVLDDREAYTCSGGEWKFVRDILESVEAEDSLPECFPKNDGDLIWVKNESKVFKCDRRSWVEVEIESSSSSEDEDNGSEVEEEDEDELPRCSKRREGKVWTVESENKTYLCSEGEWEEIRTEESSSSESEEDPDDPILVNPEESSSSAIVVIIVPASSDSEESSSSADISDSEDSSSSEEIEESSSSYSYLLLRADGDLWNGWASEYSVNTGVDAGGEDAGRWFEYNDSPDFGTSEIEWPVPRGNDYDEGAFDPIIDVCGGICGKYELKDGYNYPFVGIGFNIAGPGADSTDATPKPADVLSWGGVCIVYTLDRAGILEMGFTDSLEQEMEYDVPMVTLLKSTDGTVVNFEWNDFLPSGWGNGLVLSGDSAATQLVSLKFRIQGKSGDSGHFNVIAVGKYGSCKLYN